MTCTHPRMRQALQPDGSPRWVAVLAHYGQSMMFYTTTCPDCGQDMNHAGGAVRRTLPLPAPTEEEADQ